ncbi:MAG: hypothetical protein ACRDHZ_15420 [Ktedonobacteraceae bacterium]
MKNLVDLDLYIKDLKRRESDLLGHLDEVHADLAELQRQMKTAEAVKTNYYRHFKMAVTEPSTSIDDGLRRKFASLPIREMLLIIGIESDGILDLSEARRILVQAGVFKDERNAATSIAPVITRHEDMFKRVGRGVYAIKGRPHFMQTTTPATMAPQPQVRTTSYLVIGQQLLPGPAEIAAHLKPDLRFSSTFSSLSPLGLGESRGYDSENHQARRDLDRRI